MHQNPPISMFASLPSTNIFVGTNPFDRHRGFFSRIDRYKPPATHVPSILTRKPRTTADHFLRRSALSLGHPWELWDQTVLPPRSVPPERVPEI